MNLQLKIFHADEPLNREGDLECGALADFTGDVDVAVVDLDDGLDDGKPKAAACHGIVFTAMAGVIEFLEYLGKIFFRDADARVGHSNNNIFIRTDKP